MAAAPPPVTADRIAQAQEFAGRGRSAGIFVIPVEIVPVELKTSHHGLEPYIQMEYKIRDERFSPPFITPQFGLYHFKRINGELESVPDVCQKIIEHYDLLKTGAFNIKLSDQALRSCFMCSVKNPKVFPTVAEMLKHQGDQHLEELKGSVPQK